MAQLNLLHQYFTRGLLVLVLMHVAGMLFTSIGHGENLVAAMVSGRKPPPDHGEHTIV